MEILAFHPQITIPLDMIAFTRFIYLVALVLRGLEFAFVVCKVAEITIQTFSGLREFFAKLRFEVHEEKIFE